jgi:hypothetical protein
LDPPSRLVSCRGGSSLWPASRLLPRLPSLSRMTIPPYGISNVLYFGGGMLDLWRGWALSWWYS